MRPAWMGRLVNKASICPFTESAIKVSNRFQFQRRKISGSRSMARGKGELWFFPPPDNPGGSGPAAARQDRLRCAHCLTDVTFT